MPEYYKNAKVNVFCNDCEKNSIIPFHVLGGKCLHCRSYNTMRDKGEIFFEEEVMRIVVLEHSGSLLSSYKVEGLLQGFSKYLLVLPYLV